VSSAAQDKGPAVPRILLLCAGDPDGARAFSGSARSLARALEARGVLHHKANVLGWTDSFQRGPLPVRLLRRVDRRLGQGFEERYRWSRLAFARNSRRAARIAAAHPGFDACLMYGTTFLPVLDVPRYCYFDATFAQVREARAWGFPNLSEAQANRVHAYQQSIYAACTGIFPRTRWAAYSVRADFGVSPEKIHPAGAGPNHRVAPLPHAPYDRQTILFVGADWERKGGPLLAAAFERVRQRLPGARLVVVGCTPPVAGAGIEVAGFLDKDSPEGMQRLLQYYSEASVFCMMSAFEPFGIVVVEAQHAGVPCVLPRRFAFPEIVEEGRTGRLLAQDDPEALAALLVELLSAPEKLAEMGAAARAFAQREWTWDVAAARICTQIARDIAEKGGAGGGITRG